MNLMEQVRRRRLVLSNLKLLLDINNDRESPRCGILTTKEVSDIVKFRNDLMESDSRDFDVSVSQIVTFKEIYLDNELGNRKFGLGGQERFLTDSCAEVFFNLMYEYCLIAERQGLGEQVDIETANRRGPEGEKLIVDAGGSKN